MTQLSAQHLRIVVWIGLFGLVAQFTLLLLKAARISTLPIAPAAILTVAAALTLVLGARGSKGGAAAILVVIISSLSIVFS